MAGVTHLVVAVVGSRVLNRLACVTVEDKG
jgi:hypothetical protein